MNIHFHPEAEEEISHAQAWYMQRSKIAARAFTMEFTWAIRQISEAPARWVRYEQNTHRFILPNFPFSVIYRIHQDEVHIIAVAHHRRRPGYWHDR